MSFTESISHKGEKFEVKNGKLNLSLKKIKDINEIKELEKLMDLKILDLGKNQISKIKGLEYLINLEQLSLYAN